ncbi:MAG: hypothetical protein JO090_00095, partial [Rhizobacter sp.]|nr:hypothetical protein [Rhizobacter sp.]
MRISTVTLLCSLALALLVLQPASAASSSAKALEDAMGQDGLQKIDVKGIELAYAKPG